MALQSFSDLKTSVANWLDRSDLTDQIPDFITLAESRISRTLRVHEMEERSQMTTIADKDHYGLPEDWLQARHIKVVEGRGGVDRDLEYKTPEAFDIQMARLYGASTGEPRFYTVLGNEIRYGPSPSAGKTIEILYYAKPTTLSNTNTSNTILNNYPDIYLYAAVLEGKIYIEDNDGVMKYGKLYDQAVQNAEDSDARNQHSGGALHVSGEQFGY